MTPKNNIKANIIDFKLSTHQEISEELGRRLRVQRLAKKLKQQDLADRAGLSVGTVKNLESKGQSSLESLIRIVVALDLLQDFEGLFAFKAQSIAQMEKLEKLKSQVVSRRVR